MEPIKHHKYKPFTRKNIMDIAKIIRNVTMPPQNRASLIVTMANYFEKEDPFFDRKRFNDVARGVMTHDTKTEPFSKLKDL